MRVSDGGGGGDSRAGPRLGLDRDLGSMSLESPCELRDRESSPFSSNRTMFETEEVGLSSVCLHLRSFPHQTLTEYCMQ